MQTTAPVSATGPESTADELAVRWLYPRDLADTPLSEAQLTLVAILATTWCSTVPRRRGATRFCSRGGGP